MNVRKHLSLFFKEHLWVILLFLISSILSVAILSVKQGGTIGDILYYSCLPVVMLVLVLFYRLYVTWNYYELLLTKSDKIDDYILPDKKAASNKSIQQLLLRIRRLYNGERLEKESWKKSQQLMIYQWVHQVKTPLSVINMIAQNHKNDADYQKIAKMEREIQYDLNQILSMYRLEQMENDFVAEKINLYETVRSSVNDLKNSFIENGIYPKMNIPKDLYVYTDKKWMGIVFYQLLTNAIKYSPANASVCLEATQENETVFLSVTDQGCGISKEDINRIFELFFTGENGRQYGESSGIGLYMVKRILDYLGHTIKVESSLNEGSRFTIKF